MRKSRFTDSQIVAILNEGEPGVPLTEICSKNGISIGFYYQWKSKVGGVSVSELKRIRKLEEENSRLKRMHAVLALERAAIKAVLPRKL